MEDRILNILPEYKRQDGEHEELYKLRICEQQPAIGTWEDVADILNAELGNDFEPSAYRKPYQYYKRIDNAKAVEKAKEEDYLTELEEKTFRWQKERQKTRDLTGRLNQMIREQSRKEAIYEELAIIAKDVPFPKPPKNIITKEDNDTSGILFVSDTHYGADFSIPGLRGEILNHYSVEEFEKRMWKLLDDVLLIVKKEKLKSLNVFDLGDNIEGILRLSSLNFIKYGIVDSTMGYAKFMITWLNKLSESIYIDFYRTQGNHDDLRIISGKKGDFPHENVGKIITEFIKLGLTNNPNVRVHDISDTKHIYLEMYGEYILATHGEESNQGNAIKDYEDLYGHKVNYLYGGHLHSKSALEVSFTKEVKRVGSIIGVNDYAIGLRKSARPSATLDIFVKDKGRFAEYTIRV